MPEGLFGSAYRNFFAGLCRLGIVEVIAGLTPGRILYHRRLQDMAPLRNNLVIPLNSTVRKNVQKYFLFRVGTLENEIAPNNFEFQSEK